MAYRSRERVERILDHREADRVPFCAFHAPFFDEPQPEVVGLIDELGLSGDHRAMCLEGDFAGVRADPAPLTEIFRPFLGDIPVDAEISFWGYATSPLRTAEGYEAGSRIYHPLARVDTLEELKEFPFPDVIRSGADEGLEGNVAALKEDEYTVLGQMSATVLETAYYLRGIPQLMIDFYERPAPAASRSHRHRRRHHQSGAARMHGSAGDQEGLRREAGALGLHAGAEPVRERQPEGCCRPYRFPHGKDRSTWRIGVEIHQLLVHGTVKGESRRLFRNVL
jgi:hypothetical protein